MYILSACIVSALILLVHKGYVLLVVLQQVFRLLSCFVRVLSIKASACKTVICLLIFIIRTHLVSHNGQHYIYRSITVICILIFLLLHLSFLDFFVSSAKHIVKWLLWIRIFDEFCDVLSCIYCCICYIIMCLIWLNIMLVGSAAGKCAICFCLYCSGRLSRSSHYWRSSLFIELLSRISGIG